MDDQRSVGVVVSGNGLGHLKRALRVIETVVSRWPEVAVTVFHEPWQRDHVRLAPGTIEAISSIVFRPVPMLGPRWLPGTSHFRRSLGKWHVESLSGLGLDRFDLILSDNLVEVLHHSENVVLEGSFLWHDVLRQAWPHDDVVGVYAAEMEDLLARRRPPMLVSEYFAMPATQAHARPQPIGLVNLSDRPALLPSGSRSGVLVAVGNSDAAEAAAIRAIPVLTDVVDGRHPLFAGERIAEVLRKRGLDVEPFDFGSDSWARLAGCCLRAGIGTITECVAARVPMFFIDDPNPEIAHNQAVLLSLGIGEDAARVTDFSETALGSREERRQVQERMSAISLAGAADAAEFLAQHLRLSPPYPPIDRQE